MPFSMQVIYKGHGWKEGEIAQVNPIDWEYLEHESKKIWKENGKNENDFNDNFVIINITDRNITDKDVFGILAPYNLLDSSQANMRRYKIDMSKNKKLYKDLKKDGEMSVVWSDIVDDIVDMKQ